MLARLYRPLSPLSNKRPCGLCLHGVCFLGCCDACGRDPSRRCVWSVSLRHANSWKHGARKSSRPLLFSSARTRGAAVAPPTACRHWQGCQNSCETFTAPRRRPCEPAIAAMTRRHGQEFSGVQMTLIERMHVCRWYERQIVRSLNSRKHTEHNHVEELGSCLAVYQKNVRLLHYFIV